jgi:hypothetical protein
LCTFVDTWGGTQVVWLITWVSPHVGRWYTHNLHPTLTQPSFTCVWVPCIWVPHTCEWELCGSWMRVVRVPTSCVYSYAQVVHNCCAPINYLSSMCFLLKETLWGIHIFSYSLYSVMSLNGHINFSIRGSSISHWPAFDDFLSLFYRSFLTDLTVWKYASTISLS